jgi:hypothetical protein
MISSLALIPMGTGGNCGEMGKDRRSRVASHHRDDNRSLGHEAFFFKQQNLLHLGELRLMGPLLGCFGCLVGSCLLGMSTATAAEAIAGEARGSLHPDFPRDNPAVLGAVLGIIQVALGLQIINASLKRLWGF